MGQLVHNPELYNNLNRAAQNIEQLSRQLEPIVNDILPSTPIDIS